MRRPFIIIAIVAGGLLGWLYWQQSRPDPFVVSGFIEADEIRIGSQVGGRVAEVMAEEGRSYKAGTPLYRLSPFDLEDQLAKAKAELAATEAEHARLKSGYRAEEIAQARARRDHAQALLDKFMAGPRPQEITIAQEQLAAAQARLALAESEYDRLNRLREQDSAAKLEFDTATKSLKTARSEVAEAEQTLSLLREGTRKEEIAEARADLAEAAAALALIESGFRTEDVAQAAAAVHAAEANVAVIHARLNELVIESPCDCVLDAFELQPGDLVAANAPTAALLDLNRLWVRTYVPVARLAEVSLGDRVPVRIDGMPDTDVVGRITFIATEAEFTPRNVQTPEERRKQVFRIKVMLEPGDNKQPRVGTFADVLLGEKVGP